jgi:hypothetical protein
MITCHDCEYLGGETIKERGKRHCLHRDNREDDLPTITVTLETTACAKVVLTHKARIAMALEEIARKLKR